MTEQINDGGPAFPVIGVKQDEHCQTVTQDVYCNGMTLRDYFAAKVIDTLISLSVTTNGAWSAEGSAVRAYDVADEMLKARNRQ